MKTVQYYLIHNNDKKREEKMLDQFERVNINNDDVKWIRNPNKEEITDDFLNSILIDGWSITCGNNINAKLHLRKGQISCTYKHYLCVKDMIENNYEYGVVMEDNMYLIDDVPKKLNIYIEQLDRLYPDWDIIFDNYGITGKLMPYKDELLKEGQFVYPKTNQISDGYHGGTKCAVFYLLNLKCAKRLYEHYLPFNNTADWWLNDLLRKIDAKCFWAEPYNVGIAHHISTA
jgi:GR25 family glycosyltransferase involved in LPS biosynthesis